MVKQSPAIPAVAQLLGSAKDAATLRNLLTDLLTPQEAEALAERIQILKLLNSGITQREAAAKLGISVTTVNRGSRVIQYGTGAARNVK